MADKPTRPIEDQTEEESHPRRDDPNWVPKPEEEKDEPRPR